MTKIALEAITRMPLSSFNIKPLTNWVARNQKAFERNMLYIRELPAETSDEEVLNQTKVAMRKNVHTVGDLIRIYPYRFYHRWWQDGSKRGAGLGQKPIEQLKKKLLELGLTPDDWPALAHHDELLEKLSKKVILSLPILEVLVTSSGYDDRLHGYLGCEQSELGTKTVKDFISIDPSQEGGDYYSTRFFKRRKQQFLAIRQKLVAKGFTARDGAFFKWNPEKKSLAKARKVLEKHGLPHKERERFAKILVAERLVI